MEREFVYAFELLTYQHVSSLFECSVVIICMKCFIAWNKEMAKRSLFLT